MINFQAVGKEKRSEIRVDAKLARQGSELKFTAPPTNANIKPAPDPNRLAESEENVRVRLTI
ncbi:hypothetical protein [Parasphingorhabdus sp.]|uniref:hypothetical protein n=1 Tax=Parasphingorhabdus sp. TaxID=2709688 RepID=UPI0032668235